MTTATQAAPSTQFGVGFRDLLVHQLEQEMKTTKRVLAAVPDAKRNYRPDEHARTAGELAEHIALSDVQFLQGINALSFAEVFGDPEASKKAGQPAVEPGQGGDEDGGIERWGGVFVARGQIESAGNDGGIGAAVVGAYEIPTGGV